MSVAAFLMFGDLILKGDVELHHPSAIRNADAPELQKGGQQERWESVG